MKGRLQAWVIGLAMMAVHAGVAAAQWRLDLEGGAFIPVSRVEFREGNTEIDAGLGTGAAFAVGGAYGLADWVDLTAQFQVASTLGLFDDHNVDVFSITPGARVFVLPATYRFRPWLGGQIGWYLVDGQFHNAFLFDEDADDVDKSENSFGLNVGGGFDFAINHRVSLGIDVRYHNAFDALGGFQFVTTMVNVGIHFGED